MPTKHPRVSVVLTQDELDQIRRDALLGESDSNLIRHKLQLPPLKQGPPAGNQNARRITAVFDRHRRGLDPERRR